MTSRQTEHSPRCSAIRSISDDRNRPAAKSARMAASGWAVAAEARLANRDPNRPHHWPRPAKKTMINSRTTSMTAAGQDTVDKE